MDASRLWRSLVQNPEESSTSQLTPLACKGKEKQTVRSQGEMYTHFVSLPLAIYPELKKKVEAFQSSILDDKNPLKFQATLAEMGIEKSIFVSPKSFHLTVVMLKLGNKESVDAAKDILKSISSNVRHALDNRPVFIRLKGLDCMTGSLDKTRVLYAPVEEVGHENRLLSACHVIIDAFAKAGFAGKDAKSRLKLHATLINANYRKGGTTQMKIEEETGVKIIFPSSRNEDHIIIEGGSVECVTRASESIATLIEEVVRSPSLDYSHFVSLPLAIHPKLVDKLLNFQNSILGNHGMAMASKEQDDQANRSSTSVAVDLKATSETNEVNVDIKSIPIVSYQPKAKETTSSTLFDLGIEKSIFIKPNTFHLTVLMLKLWNKDRVNAARDVLKSVSPIVMDALDNRPIFIRLKGLDCMKGPLAKARVLYVPVEEIGDEGRLLRACQVITDAFVKAGLVLEKDAKQSLKLHATVINARHRKRKDKRKKMETFDAREIHKQFGNEEWGEYLIPEAHLSQRFVFDQSGYYRCCASIPFPGEESTP